MRTLAQRGCRDLEVCVPHIELETIWRLCHHLEEIKHGNKPFNMVKYKNVTSQHPSLTIAFKTVCLLHLVTYEPNYDKTSSAVVFRSPNGGRPIWFKSQKPHHNHYTTSDAVSSKLVSTDLIFQHSLD